MKPSRLSLLSPFAPSPFPVSPVACSLLPFNTWLSLALLHRLRDTDRDRSKRGPISLPCALEIFTFLPSLRREVLLQQGVRLIARLNRRKSRKGTPTRPSAREGVRKGRQEERESEGEKEREHASSRSSSTFPGRYESLWRRDSRLFSAAFPSSSRRQRRRS